MNDNLIAIIGENKGYGFFAGKLFFDSRQRMPSQKEVLMIIKKHIDIAGKKVTIIDPPLNIDGKYTNNYFDFIFKSDEKEEIKVFYENKELLENFKKNPFVTWETNPVFSK